MKDVAFRRHSDRRARTALVGAMLLLSVVAAQALVAGQNARALALAVLPVVLFGLARALLAEAPGPWLLGTALAIFWVPVPMALSTAPSPLTDLSLVEVVVYLSLVIVLVRLAARQEKTSIGNLRGFPWIGSALLCIGAVVAYVSTPQASDGLPVLRVTVFLPLALGLLTMLTVRSVKDARRALWIVAGASAILGVLFLVANGANSSVITQTSYGAGMGLNRGSLALRIPGFATLGLHPESAGEKFAIAFCLAWFLLLTTSGATRRAGALLTAAVCGTAVVIAQGRSGLVACGLAVVLLGAWAVWRGGDGRVWAAAATVGSLAALFGSTVALALRSPNTGYAARVVGAISDPTAEVLSGRLDIWRQAFAYVVAEPLGLGPYPPQYAMESSWQTHNLWLFTGVTFGWLGLAGLALILLRLGAGYVKGMRAGGAHSAGLAALGLVLLVITLATGTFSPLVWYPFFVIFVWAPLWITFAAATNVCGRQTALVPASSAAPPGG